MTKELTLLHESVVKPEEIDSLGHMNVRYYVTRAARANDDLLVRAGCWDGDTKTQFVRRIDTYTRFMREQFAGATLHTYGGIISTESAIPDSVSAYFEIRNPDTGAIAASFIFTSHIIDRSTAAPLAVRGVDETFAVQVPEYGMPRSLSLRPPRKVTMDIVSEIVGDEPAQGMMSGRREGTVQPEDCDDSGYLKEDADVMFVIHRPQPGEDLSKMGPPVLRDEEGRRYSWAVMETRNLTLMRPRSGDSVVSLGADLEYGEKWRKSRRWMFIKDSGELLGVSDTVAVCIDLDARKAISVPAEVRATMEELDLKDLL